MPLYEYQCVDCQTRELRVAALDDHTALCAACGSLMLRLDTDVLAPYFEPHPDCPWCGQTQSGPAEEFCNVALHSCGGWQAVKMIGKDTKRGMGRFLAECLEYPDVRIERWPLEKFRQEGFICQCLKEPAR